MATKKRDKRADNALRSGLRIRADFCTARLPDGCGHIRRQANRFRRIMEAELLEQYGQLSAYHAALCQSATRHEVRAQLASRWLWKAKEDGKPLGLDEQLALLKVVSDATDARDRCMRAAGLDSADRTQSVWDAIYRTPLPATPPQPADDTEAAETTADAGDEATSDDSGNGEGL